MKSINPDKGCQDMCAILNTIVIHKLLTHWKDGGKNNERNESEILPVLWHAYGRDR